MDRRTLLRASVLASMTLFAGCDIGIAETVPDRAQLEAFLRTRLPPSAEDLHANEQGFTDRLIRLRFDAPEAEVLSFAKRLLPDPLASVSSIELASFGTELDWWVPTPLPQNSLSAQADPRDDFVYVRILVTPLPGGKRRVWVAAFTT